mmetsp:Transcript_29949/g.105337  ORF Transcript_29949/g.105337 Transcript_29949/m.105337 type:complete len:270 (-) Transcript_29949:16-825(-)
MLRVVRRSGRLHGAGPKTACARPKNLSSCFMAHCSASGSCPILAANAAASWSCKKSTILRKRSPSRSMKMAPSSAAATSEAAPRSQRPNMRPSMESGKLVNAARMQLKRTPPTLSWTRSLNATPPTKARSTSRSRAARRRSSAARPAAFSDSTCARCAAKSAASAALSPASCAASVCPRVTSASNCSASTPSTPSAPPASAAAPPASSPPPGCAGCRSDCLKAPSVSWNAATVSRSTAPPDAGGGGGGQSAASMRSLGRRRAWNVRKIP